MNIERFVDHPLLKACKRQFSPSQPLFQQGDIGDTMFIIVEGQVRLVGQFDNHLYTAAMITKGEFLGERAILEEQPHRRVFSAIAETEVIAIEMGPTEVARLEDQAPYLLKALMKRSFEMAEARLDRANRLIQVLRSSDNNERFLDCIIFLAETMGRKEIAGIRVNQLAENIHNHTDIGMPHIKIRLTDLVKQSLLVSHGGDDYTIPSLESLIDRSQQIKYVAQAA